MSSSARKWLKFAVRWGIAVAGIAIVLANISLHDRVFALGHAAKNHPAELNLIDPPPAQINTQTRLNVVDHDSGKTLNVGRADLVNRPDRKTVTLADGTTVPLLAMDLSDDARDARVRRLLIEDAQTGDGRWILPGEVRNFELRVPNPLIDRGVRTMLRGADRSYLWLAIGIFPVVFVITAMRWQALLRAIDVALPLQRVFALNMVGCFYNSFMPGSTGGDLLKAYYVAKQTHLRTRAVMSVIVDRVIGLLALVILGGAMSTFQWLTSRDPSDPATHKCLQVAIGSAGILFTAATGLAVFYIPVLRRYSGLALVLRRLPMQTQVQKAVETMELYRRRPMLVLFALLITLPVHATVVVSAMLCGMAFHLPLQWWYYFVAVPVIVLSGSIPVSPQGAGVMEFFAILLTRRQGCTIGEAFALTMSIRLVQILWNLTGGVFVMKGGYHAPTQTEQDRLIADDSAAPVPASS